jgi:hypothetical protein
MHHRKKMRGGFLENLLSSAKSTLSNFTSTLSNDATTVWDNTKKASSGAYNSVVGNSVTPSYNTTGGRRQNRKHTRKGGGHNGIATNSAPFSGVTAQPHNLVGGKRRHTKKHHTKRRHRYQY